MRFRLDVWCDGLLFLHLIFVFFRLLGGLLLLLLLLAALGRGLGLGGGRGLLLDLLLLLLLLLAAAGDEQADDVL